MEMCGYRCLDQRYRVNGGEIDLVMAKQGVIAFVEVKTRRFDSAADPEEFVTRKQLALIRRASVTWLRSHNPAYQWVRVDVVTVQYAPGSGRAQVRHYPDAR